jgi:galactokinase
MKKEELIAKFKSIYGESKEEIKLYFAPGRVNLIGEHTDYNNGYVLPCALNFGTYLAVRKCHEPYLEFTSEGFEYAKKIPLQEKYEKSGREWINYPLGIIETFRRQGYSASGLQFFYSGNIPAAAGLSSSASIEMATAYALNDIYNWNYSIRDIINLSKKSENDFIGVNCGIMDMFAVGEGKKDHAIFLNCSTLEFELVPVCLPGYRLVIINTNKKRGLGDSKYNERVEECKMALNFLNKRLAIASLGDINIEDFEEYNHIISDETVLKRARHIVSENQRVLKAVEALRINDLDRVGKLMVESHNSLRDDYEVTGLELDCLVELAMKQEGVIGARMTGAGFGGCAVAIVKEGITREFISFVSEAYQKVTGLKPEFYLPEIGDGVKKVVGDMY